MMDADERINEIWRQYERGMEYQEKIGLPHTIKTNVAFFEGDQWAKPTERTKSLPRPVVNIVKMIVRAKVSAMNNTPVRIVYEADSAEKDTLDFTNFAEYICKEMKMDELDALALLDGAIKGSYTYHFYWDVNAKGKKGNEDGALRCDIIDPRHIIFSNPTQTDEQKQKWIIIITREEVASVKEQCEKEEYRELICADDRTPDDPEEQDGTEMCTVLTRYSRVNGNVVCEKATKFCIFKPQFSISPDYAAAAKKLGYDDYDEEEDGEDAADTDTPDNPRKDKPKTAHHITDFPVVVGQYERKEGCIYGLSEVSGLIANQRSINFNLAMLLLSVQQTAWGKYVVLPNALNGQEISNDPGQVLVDYTKTGQGIKTLPAEQINTLPMTIIDNMLSYTRTVAGSTEVMTGETTGANMSGAAIAQLQAQAQQPIEDLRDRFWRAKEKQGRIIEQFFRCFYREDTHYSYKRPADTTPTGETIDSTAQQQAYTQATFNASKYDNVDFSIVAKACTGTRSSAAGDIAFLDNLLSLKAITVKQYAEAYPEEALSDKGRFIKLIDQGEQSQLMQAQAMLQETQLQMQQMSAYIEQFKKAVASAQATANENEKLKADLAVLYKKYTDLEADNQKLVEAGNQVYDDASLFAQELYDSKYKGSPTETDI